MKRPVIKIIALVILISSFIVGNTIISYASEARAYASVIIIIPERKNISTKEIAKIPNAEKPYAQEITSSEDDQKSKLK